MFSLLVLSYTEGVSDHVLNGIAMVCAMIQGVSWPLFGILFGQLVSAVGDVNATPTSIRADTERVALYMLLVGAGAITVSSIWNFLLALTATRRSNRLRAYLFETLSRNDMSWFDTNSSKISSLVVEQLSVSKYKAGIGTKLGFFVYNVTQGIAGFSIGFIYGWQMPLVVLACTPLIAVSTMLLNRSVIASSQQAQSAYSKATGVCEESVFSIRTVHACNGEEKQISKFKSFLAEGYKSIKSVSWKLASSYGLNSGSVFLLFAIAFAVGGVFIRDNVGNYNGGNVISVLVAVLTGAFGFGQTSISLQAFGEAEAAIRAVNETLASCKSDIREGQKSEDHSPSFPSVFQSLDLKNVSFHYSPDRPVLRDISMSIKAGSRVAIVGESGSGKSSLVGLLMRFYDPVTGSISINQTVEYNTIQPVQDLRNMFGYVAQEPVLFSKSIRDNLTLGLNNVSDAELFSVLEAVNARDFIEKLPNKLDTLCGVSAGLSQLSGGQKQRIAIARALLRKPKILILDEATSALDTESERSVIESLKKVQSVFPELTTVSIAHRLSTVRDSDQIFVFGSSNDGIPGSVVLESGTHANLMQLGQVYARLVGAQQIDHPETSRPETPRESYIPRTDSVKDSSSLLDEKKPIEIEKLSVVEKLNFLRNMGYCKGDTASVVLGLIGSIGKGVALPIDSFIFSSVAGYYFISDKNEMMRNVGIASVEYAGLAVGVFIATALAIGLFSSLAETVTNRLRVRAFTAILMDAPVAFFDVEKNAPSLTTSTVVQSSGKAASLVTILPRVVMEAAASLTMGCVISFTASWKLAAVLVSTFPVILAAAVVSASAYMGVDPKVDDENSGEMTPEKRLLQIASECLQNMRTVRSLGLESLLVNEYRCIVRSLNREARWKSLKSGVAFGVSMGLIYFSNSLGYWYGGKLVASKEIDVTQMTRAILGPMLTSLAIGEALVFLPDVGQSLKAADELIDVLKIEKFNQRTNRSTLVVLPTVSWQSIDMKNLEFNYPSRPNIRVLKGLSMRLPLDGKRIALVGASGGGKSTIFSLLLRFYDPSSGCILLNGSMDISTLDKRSYRSRIAYVSQEPVLFDTSLRENVSFGIEKVLDENELTDLKKKAHLDFIDSNPEGWDMQVGPRGSRLSGGQKQRVAIARAIARKPELLLMDEATSALDTVSEGLVQESVESLLNNKECRAVVVVAHRLSTVVNSDLILVVQDGRVVQTGTHYDLITQTDGPYARLHAAGR